MNTIRGEVHLIGLGALTTLGRTAMSSWIAVRTGISRFGGHPVARDQQGQAAVVAMATYLPAELPVAERMGQLAAGALEQALVPLHSPPDGLKIPPLPVFLGLPSPRPGLPEASQRVLSRHLLGRSADQLELSGLQFFPGGHCAGMRALEGGLELMMADNSALCLVGGVDSFIAPETLEWLDREGRLRSSSTAPGRGFFPSEAAAFCLLAREPEALGLRSLGRIVSFASAVEPPDESVTVSAAAPLESEQVMMGFEQEFGHSGQPLAQVFEAVCGALGEGRLVTQTICDLNGEQESEREFVAALVKRWDSFHNTQRLVRPCGVNLGDVGAAAGPLFLALAACSLASDTSLVHETLLSTMSDHGERSAALLAPPPRE